MKCTKCGKEKDLAEFKKDSECKSGVRNVCKECIKGDRITNRYRRKGDTSDKECLDCHKVLPINDFPILNKAKGYIGGYCKKCHNKRRQSRRTTEFYKKRLLKREYGLTQEDFDRMLETQEGKCLICGKVFQTVVKREACVDHSHTTGEVRGLLCASCNSGLGFFKDNTGFLNRAIQYLNKEL